MIQKKDCNYNVTVEWEDRSISHEPHNILVMMPQKYVQNTDRNTTFWMNLDGNGFAVSPNQIENMRNIADMKSFHNTVQ